MLTEVAARRLTTCDGQRSTIPRSCRRPGARRSTAGGCSARRSVSGGRCGPPGCAIDLGAAVDFARALTLVDIGDREQVRAAGEADLRPPPRRSRDLRRGLRPLVAAARPACRATSQAPPLQRAGDEDHGRRGSRRRGRADARASERADLGSDERGVPDPVGRRRRLGRRRRHRGRSWSRPTPTRAARCSATASSTG